MPQSKEALRLYLLLLKASHVTESELSVTRFVCPHFTDEKSLLQVDKETTITELGAGAVNPELGFALQYSLYLLHLCL